MLRIPAGKSLYINDASCDDLENLDIVIEVYGNLTFSSGGGVVDALYLSSTSSILIYGSGSVDAVNCNSKKQIYFGGTLVASCNGTGAAYDFGDVNNAGGVGAGGPVPVQWLSFEAEAKGRDVSISWSTASETNNSHFEVEYSLDAQNWQTAAVVHSKAENGNSNEVLNYNHIDHLDDLVTEIYYRIKQVDFNGDFEYTKPVAVQPESLPLIQIVNKGDGRVSITNKSTKGEIKMRVFDLKGSIIKEAAFSTSLEINFKQSGVYLFELNRNGVISFEKFFVL